MKFRYARYGKTLRPVIPITLKSNNQKINYEVLVDSGADLCIFDAEIGRAIGIEVEKGERKEVFGIGGKASIYFLCPVQIEVGGWLYDIKAGFMTQVAGHMFQYGVVGQLGFFENFIVKFDLIKEEVELKRRDN